VPDFPALSLLIALYVVNASPRVVTIGIGAILPIVLVTIALLPRIPRLRNQSAFELHFGAFLRWLFSATVVLALAAGAALAWNHRVTHAVAVAAIGSLVALTLTMTGDEEMSPISSAEQPGEMQREGFPNEMRTAPFYSFGMFSHSLPFTLERPVTPLAYRGELELEFDARPAKAIATLEKFRDVWMAADDALP